MDADLHAVLGIAKLDARMRTHDLINGVLSRSFVLKHPTLVRMLQAEDLKPAVVESLIKRVASVREGNENFHDASVAVGQTLVDTYISGPSDDTQPARQ